MNEDELLKMLEYLRCPFDPSNTRLRFEKERFVCERCALRFCIKDNFPVMLVEEAELPDGCQSLQDLPCQREGKT